MEAVSGWESKTLQIGSWKHTTLQGGSGEHSVGDGGYIGLAKSVYRLSTISSDIK